MNRQPKACADRGAAAVELAILVPAIVLLLGVAVAGGRIWLARAVVTDAASGAARAATLSRSAGEATSAAQRAADGTLSTGGLTCSARAVSVNAGAFALPPGVPGTVTSTVSCTVGLADVAIPGLPGSITLQAQGQSALDTYRERG